MATISADTSLNASVGTLRRRAMEMMKRYRQEPMTMPRILTIIFPLPQRVSPMTRDASAMVTIPVPRLMSQVLLYWPMRQPARPVREFEKQSPTVMVNIGLMEEALTMAGLSPVARMERPRVVPRNHLISAQTSTTITARRISADQSFQKAESLNPLKREKMVSVPKMETLELKPMTARFTV